MKRPLSSNTSPHKRSKPAGATLLCLPPELLEHIFGLLSRRDVISLSCTDSHHRSELSRYVYNGAQILWYDLTNGTHGLLEHSRWVQSLRIVDHYAYGEWQIDIFGGHLSRDVFPNLRHLYVNSTNSTNWLKYRENDFLTSLSLYFDPTHLELLQKLHSAPLRPAIVSTNPKIFNITHLNHFTRLTELFLDLYHFNWHFHDDLNQLTRLQKLKIRNCTWEYPFNLSQFNLNDSLETLEIEYSESNSFILSERFNTFLEAPLTGHSHSIRDLSIVFEDYPDHTWHKLLSFRQLGSLINKESFPRLRHLMLSGWLLNISHFHQYLLSVLSPQDNQLTELTVHAVDQPSVVTSVAQVQEIAKKRFPGMQLRLSRRTVK